MIEPVPDELIMAFADGELDARLAERVSVAIRNDDEIRRKYQMFVSTRAVLERAFDGILHEPVPRHLTRAVASARQRAQHRRHS